MPAASPPPLPSSPSASELQAQRPPWPQPQPRGRSDVGKCPWRPLRDLWALSAGVGWWRPLSSWRAGGEVNRREGSRVRAGTRPEPGGAE